MVIPSGEVETMRLLLAAKLMVFGFRMVIPSGEVETPNLTAAPGLRFEFWMVIPSGEVETWNWRGFCAAIAERVPDGYSIRGS